MIRESGWESGMEKAALSADTALNVAGIGAGIGAVGLGGVAVYDIMKARGMTDAGERVVDAISEQRQVKSIQFVAKIDKKIKVLTNFQQIRGAMQREMGRRKGRIVAKYLWAAIKDGNNAWALRGTKGDYIGAANITNANVLAHEIGHIYDFRAKNLTWKNMGPYTGGFKSMLWRPSYEKTTMEAEREAWRLAPVKRRDKDMKELEQAALETYDKNFHANRGALSTFFAMSLLYMIAIIFGVKGELKSERTHQKNWDSWTKTGPPPGWGQSRYHW